MKPSQIIVVLSVTSILAASTAVFFAVHEPSRVAAWRERAERLDKHCQRVRIRIESERLELSDPAYRAQRLGWMRDEMRIRHPDGVSVCVRDPIDLARRRECADRADYGCLVEQDAAIEAAIGAAR